MSTVRNILIGSLLLAAGYGLAWYRLGPQTGTEPVAVAESDILARVGGRLITREQFERVRSLRRERNPMLYRDRSQQEGLLAELVERVSLLEAAREAGLDRDPYVQEACERAVINRFVQERLETALAETALSDEEVQQYYQTHRDQFAVPPRYKPAIILLPAPPNGDADGWQRLERQAADILRQANDMPAGVTHWAELARLHSAHRASRYQGGALAWINPLQKGHAALPAAVLDALFALEQPGQMAPPVKTEKGLWLVRLQALEPGRVRRLEEVRQALAYRLRREKRQQVRQAVVERYLGAQAVEVWPERLQATAPAAENTSNPPALPGQSHSTEMQR